METLISEKIFNAAVDPANENCSVEQVSNGLFNAANFFKDITGASRVVIYFLDDQLNCLVVKADTSEICLGTSFNIKTDLYPGRLLQVKEPYAESGYISEHIFGAHIKGYIALPLLCGNNYLGLIEVFESQDIYLISPDMLQTLSFPVSLGLRNLQISEELHRQSEVTDTIERIAKITGSSLRIETFYDDFAKELKKLVDFDRVSIALVDVTRNNLKVYALATERDTMLGPGKVLPLAGTAPERIIENNRPIIVSDLKREQTFLEDERLIAEGIRSALRLPLVIKDNVLATLQLNSSKVGLYGERELAILQKVAGRIAEAIENTILFNRTETINKQLKQQNIRLETLNSVALAVNESLELEVVLRKALNKVLDVTGWDCGDILAWNDTNEHLCMLVHQGLSEDFVSRWKVQKKDTLAYKTAVTGKAIYIDKLDDSGEQEYLRREGILAAIHIPLYSKQKLVGVMPIATKKEGSHPPDHDLLNSIGNQIGVAIENARLYQQIRELAEKDSLTGLWNRRKFFQMLEQEVTRSRRYNKNFALLMIDVDHFKQFNDTFGHIKGDEVLAATGQIIQNVTRKSDYPARLGGEEFAIIALESDRDSAWELAERLRSCMESEGKSRPFPTVSIGLSIYEEDGSTGDQLLLAADKALYLAKNRGRNMTVRS